MKSSICCASYQRQNTIFIDNIDEIAQKISEILPFSKIALLTFSNEFFDFGKQLSDGLLQRGIKVIEVIIADNFCAEVNKFNDFLSLPEDVRAILAFNKNLIPLLCSDYLNNKTAFFIERGEGIFGLKLRHYYVRDYGLLKAIPKNEHLYIMLNTENFNFNNHIKCACLYVNMLIDYVFRQNLLQENIDINFVNKVKSILIDTLFIVKEGEGISQNKLKENLLCVEELLAIKDCYYSCSALICSFITHDDFFNLDYSYCASKIIIKNYENMLKKPFNINSVDYNELAKTLSFITRLNQNQILSSLCENVGKIKTNDLLSIKEQIKKLILLYRDFAKNIKGRAIKEDKFYTQNLLLSIGLSGATPFGVNGMTAFQ